MSDRDGRNKHHNEAKRQDASGYDGSLQPISERLDEFTQDQWTKYMHNKGLLKASRRDGTLPGSTAFEMAQEGFEQKFYMPWGRFVNVTVDHRKSQKESKKRSSATDTGVEMNLSVGVPGAQVKPDIHFRRHLDAENTSKQADSQNQHTEEEIYVGMQAWLNAQRLALSNECLEFFNSRWWDEFGSDRSTLDLEKALITFEKEFGHTFHQDVRLGIHKQDIDVFRRDNLSEIDHQGEDRHVGGGLNIETPKGGGGFGGHQDQASQVDISTSRFSGSRATYTEHSGGDPGFLLTGKHAQPNRLNDPRIWLVLQSLNSDPVPVLDLIQGVASRMKRRANSNGQIFSGTEAGWTLDRVSELISIRNKLNKDVLQGLDDDARSVSCQSFYGQLIIRKTINFTAIVNSGVIGIELRQYNNAARHRPISVSSGLRDPKDGHRLEAQAKSSKPSKNSSIFVEVIFQLAPGWDFMSINVTNNVPAAIQEALSSKLKDAPTQQWWNIPQQNMIAFAATKEACTCTIPAYHPYSEKGVFANFEIIIQNKQLYQALHEENLSLPPRY